MEIDIGRIEILSPENNSNDGSLSSTIHVLGKSFRTFTIQTPYGQIGITVPASFPQTVETKLRAGLNLFFEGSSSTADEG